MGDVLRDRIVRQGDMIALDGTELPIQEIWYVEVVFRPPKRFIIFSAIAAIIFAVTAVGMFLLVLGSIFYWNANSSAVGGAMIIVFAVGVVACFGTFIFAMIAYPVEWRVEIATASGPYVVHVERSRTRANIYASRLRRVIGHSR
jgi:hypothetical protein